MSTQKAGIQNGELMARPFNSPKEAYLSGALISAIQMGSVYPEPVTEDGDYMAELILRFDFQDRHVKARITIEDIDFEDRF